VILVDSGVFVAAAFPNDRHHEPCRRFLTETSEDLAISVVIVAEVSQLLRRAATRPRPELVVTGY
jgi:predicted nucleic acid-binding protein